LYKKGRGESRPPRGKFYNIKKWCLWRINPQINLGAKYNLEAKGRKA
jgi:hypothetical protein